MPQLVHRYEFPDRFVSGTVGQPGERTFFVQARKGSRLTSVVCEKQQVQVLADHLERVLDELGRLSGGDIPIPPPHAVARDLDPLDAPLSEDFRAGTMTIAWDADLQAVQVELFSVTDDDDETGEGFPDPFGEGPEDPFADADPYAAAESASGEMLVAKLTPAQAREFVARARSLVAAGRPACPFCAQPINPEGHICPRANGYRRPLFLDE